MLKAISRIFTAVLIVSMVTFLFSTIAFAATDESADNINYTMDADETLSFDEDDFNEACEDVTGEELKYVKFILPDEDDVILYYKYDVDETDNTKVTSSKKYYYSDSPYLSDITLVPNEDYSNTFTIRYTGYDVDGSSYSGKIKLTINEGDPKLITYSIEDRDEIVDFDKDDFFDVCDEIQNEDLDYVRFTLPDEDDGILYYNYDEEDRSDNIEVSALKKYYFKDTSPYISRISFVPADDITGAVTISYNGTDIDGQSYEGKVQINIATSGTSISPPGITLVKSKYFKDVDEAYSWAVPFIDSLYESGIVSGSASSNNTKLYSPASYVTRGDFMLILHKALNLKTSSATSNFADVPSGSYYYTAIITAKALGIVQGSDNKFYPNSTITREDAMVMALRAVNITGKTISAGDISNLSKYNDSSSISEYSKSALASLVKAGIITGSDDNKIYPQGSLTRAQVAAIIFRIKSL